MYWYRYIYKKMFFYLSFQQWDTGIDGGQGPVVVLACQNLTIQNRFSSEGHAHL